MTYRRPEEPFTGDPPPVGPGDRVWCRTHAGHLMPMVATSGPRYDHRNTAGPVVRMTVAVAQPDGWKRLGTEAAWVSWPAEHVMTEAQHAALSSSPRTM